ncbi:MAG: bifunctional (p)ppGpp synthetase/guanosine-3',5'-bis(diphosphate) 3'-pyrophosphohydrolase [Candidatus Rickettsia vulgarisii]
MIENIVNTIHVNLLVNNITSQITYRLKNPQSILKKLLRKGGNIKDIYDVIAVRIIVDTTEDCYNSLDVISGIYTINNIQVKKNYINAPKNNGYQSIHTLIYENSFKRNIEVQIRTHEMHQIAEFGTANHHEYKQKQEAQRLFEIIISNLSLDKAYNIFSKFSWTLSELTDYEKEIGSLWQDFCDSKREISLTLE